MSRIDFLVAGYSGLDAGLHLTEISRELERAGLVVALSRFRVSNGLEGAVREAFFNRPGLVDNVPGFLGIEVFTDTEDPSLFSLITRWTDEESFRNWHSSAEHDRSHAGIPKGLKLDPSFTMIRTLERIPENGGSPHSNAIRDSTKVISEFLRASNTVRWLSAHMDGRIISSNEAMAIALRGTEGSLEGMAVWNFLTESDAATLRSDVEAGRREAARRYRLSFTGRDQMPFTMECHMDVQPDGFVLIGESVLEHEATLQRELMSLNNQLAVLLRENSRKTKALAKANDDLTETLKDLQDSHWHLKKIQEVLPICMVCGKVKTSESNWESVAEYLRRNSLFLSHGYCPSCFDEALSS